MQQRRSSASCAAADSRCAVNTTLQWVVANATAPFCALPPIPLIDVTSLRHTATQVKAAAKSKRAITAIENLFELPCPRTL